MDEGVEEKKHNKIKEFYDKQYKKLLIIPFLLLLIAIGSIGYKLATTGDFLNRDVSLKGGLTVTVLLEKDIDILELENYLSSVFEDKNIAIRTLKKTGTQIGFVVNADIEAQKSEIDSLISTIEKKIDFKLTEDDYSVEFIGSSLGASFFKETFIALVIAFLFMGFVVFLYFRIPIPSLAVILAAVSDIIITLAIVNFLGIKISTAGIAAFLMLIGYSVDTDILLSTRVLKRKEGEIIDRVLNAFKTGIVMSITTLTAVSLALIFTESETIKQIMMILLIGLLVDLINTWIQNVGILRWYLEKKAVKNE